MKNKLDRIRELVNEALVQASEELELKSTRFNITYDATSANLSISLQSTGEEVHTELLKKYYLPADLIGKKLEINPGEFVTVSGIVDRPRAQYIVEVIIESGEKRLIKAQAARELYRKQYGDR